MADFGAITGCIGVAGFTIQLFDSVQKLVAFIDNVKSAPGDIEHLLGEIQTLRHVLSNQLNRQDIVCGQASEAVEKCGKHCLDSAVHLENVLTELNATIQKRKTVGSLKTVWKKGVITKAEERLKSAQMILLFAAQSYMESLQSQRHEVQISLALSQQYQLKSLRNEINALQRNGNFNALPQTSMGSDSLPDVPKPGNTFSGNTSQQREDISNRKGRMNSVKLCRKRQGVFIRLRLPWWCRATTQALDFYMRRGTAGWTWACELRLCRVVPISADLARYWQQGNDLELRKLLDTGEASANDIDENGRPALWIAIHHRNIEVCRLLAEYGADEYYKGQRSVVSWAFRRNEFEQGSEDSEDQIKVIKALVGSYSMEDPFTGPIESWNPFITADGKFLRYILEESDSKLLERNLRDRVRYAIRACTYQGKADFLSFLNVILDGQAIDNEICSIKDCMNRTLLHVIAWATGHRSLEIDFSSSSSLGLGSPDSEEVSRKISCVTLDYRRQLFQVLRKLLNSGADLHERACRYSCEMMAHPERSPLAEDTPFTALFSSFSYAQRRYVLDLSSKMDDTPNMKYSVPAIQLVTGTVMAWLEELDNAGIDLEAYGHQEMIFRSQRQPRNHELIATQAIKRVPWYAYALYTKYYFNFTYGPKLSDWNFWFVEMMDNSLREFWDMVDHPERKIPGAWDEQFDN